MRKGMLVVSLPRVFDSVKALWFGVSITFPKVCFYSLTYYAALPLGFVLAGGKTLGY